MPRPFAVTGFTVFFTIALLYNSDTGAISIASAAFAFALVISLLISDARRNKVLPCAFASGLVACILLLSELNFYYLPAIDYAGKTCKVQAQLCDYPEYKYGKYYYDAETVDINGEAAELKLQLVFSSLPDAQPYDVVEGDFTFYILGSSSEEYLASNKAKGVFVGAYPKNGTYSVNRIPEKEKPFSKTIVDIRAAIKNAVHRSVPGENGALATALLIGDRSDLSSEIISDFRLSGITHIICVSGFHLSLCANFILALLRKLRFGERLSGVLTAIAVVMFMLIAGMTYSVMRSGIMMLIFLLSDIIFKKRDSLNSLGFALTVIAVYNPFAAGSVALQLSALSTLGLILYSQYLKPKTEELIRKTDNIYFKDVITSLVSAVMIPVSATAFTIPVLLKIYGEFNFAVYFSNIIAVPVASACILFSAGSLLLGVIFSGDFNIAGKLAELFCTILIKISDIFSKLDFLTFRADSDSGAVLLCGILLFCAMSVFMAYSGKKMIKITCALCAVMFSFGVMFVSVSKESETRISIIDVGNGTALHVSKNGENILVGCGGTEYLGASKISDNIKENGNKIDCMIIPDSDESSSSYLFDVLSFCRPDEIYFGNLPLGSELLLNRTNAVEITNHFNTENFEFDFYSFNDNDCLYMKSSDMSALVIFDPMIDYSDIPDDFKNADVIIARNDYPKNILNYECKLLVVNSENKRGVIIQDELSESDVRCVATAGCGDILIRGENGYVSANRK